MLTRVPCGKRSFRLVFGLRLRAAPSPFPRRLLIFLILTVPPSVPAPPPPVLPFAHQDLCGGHACHGLALGMIAVHRLPLYRGYYAPLFSGASRRRRHSAPCCAWPVYAGGGCPCDLSCEHRCAHPRVRGARGGSCARCLACRPHSQHLSELTCVRMARATPSPHSPASHSRSNCFLFVITRGDNRGRLSDSVFHARLLGEGGVV